MNTSDFREFFEIYDKRKSTRARLNGQFMIHDPVRIREKQKNSEDSLEYIVLYILETDLAFILSPRWNLYNPVDYSPTSFAYLEFDSVNEQVGLKWLELAYLSPLEKLDGIFSFRKRARTRARASCVVDLSLHYGYFRPKY